MTVETVFAAIGALSALGIVIVILVVVARRFSRALREPVRSYDPADSPTMKVLMGYKAEVIQKLDEMQLHGQKQVEIIVKSIDFLSIQLEKNGKTQYEYMRAILGGSTNGYQDFSSDEEVAIRERADQMVSRYKIPFEEAYARAKEAIKYDPRR